jgi:HK97 family phage major capsid protein
MAESEVTKLLNEVKSLRTEMAKPVYAANPADVTGSGTRGVPSVRRGENANTSRRLSFVKMMGLMVGRVNKENAKPEYELLKAFNKTLSATTNSRYSLDSESDLCSLPISFADLPASVTETQECSLLRAAMAPAGNADPAEMQWMARRMGWNRGEQIARAALTPAESWLDNSYGGALVKPPEYMGLIPLMRNQSMMDRAGAQFISLPPQGKAVFASQQTASVAHWIVENTTIDLTTIKTGQVMLEAKKLGIAMVVPNDLFRFASESADALFQGDMALTLALTFDYATLYGPGNGRPKGLSMYTGTNELLQYEAQTPAPGGIGANGNTPLPQDGDIMMGYLEDRNFDVDNGFKWVMRGGRWRSLAATRADAVTAGDQSGTYVEILKAFGDPVASRWAGMDVVRSAQVTNTAAKGGATNLTQIWGGMWNQCLIGMFGAVEFSRAVGEQMFFADQTGIRGIAYGDVAFRYPGAFVRYDDVLPN